MHSFLWVLPHVTLQHEEEGIVLFSTIAATREDAVHGIITYLGAREQTDGLASQVGPIEEWLSKAVPVTHDPDEPVCISSVVSKSKEVRRRIRAARALEHFDLGAAPGGEGEAHFQVCPDEIEA
jgi:hypothetical protein